MWRNHLGGARDLFVAELLEPGASWSGARKLGTGTWKLEACPMDGGALAARDSGEFSSVWRRERSLFQSDGSAAEREFAAGEQPSIARGPGGMWITWSEARAGRLLLHQPGVVEPIELDSSAIDGVLCAALDAVGPVFAAWEGGDGKLCVARLSSSSRTR